MTPRVLEWALAHPLSYFVLQRLVGGNAVRVESIRGYRVLGLRHDDPNAYELLSLAAWSLELGGRVFTMDTVPYEGWPSVPRLLSQDDTGEQVLASEGCVGLVWSHFGNIQHRPVIRHLMIPPDPRAEVS